MSAARSDSCSVPSTAAARRWVLGCVVGLAALLPSGYATALTCDVNGDGVIDRTDIKLIIKAKRSPAASPTDPRDANGDGQITTADQKLCSARCTVRNCSTKANHPPLANAGPDQSVAVGAGVTLDGTASTDPVGNALTYARTLASKPAGSAAALTGASKSIPRRSRTQGGTHAKGHRDGTAFRKRYRRRRGGAIVAYAWTPTEKPSGSTAVLATSSAALTSFVVEHLAE